MAILGLIIHSWLGWATGIFLIDRPWGPPTLKSWISIHNFWSVIVIILQHILMVDFLRQNNFLNSLSENKLTRDLHTIMFVVAYVAFWSIRFVFVMHAKKLAVLLNRLYFYSVKNQMVVWKSAWIKARVFVTLSAMLPIISATLFTISFQQRQLLHNCSWFYWAGQVGSGIIGTFFGSLPTLSAINTAFAFIISITFYMGMIFGEFCDDLEVLLRTSNMWFTKDFKIIKEQKEGTTVRVWSSKETLLKKLDYIQKTFQSADEIISPLVLVVFAAETFRLVTGAHEILINKMGGLFAIQGYVTLFEQLVHTSLVLVGQHVKDMMNKRQQQLRRLLMLHPETHCNQDAADVAKWIISFNWNLSACGFFDVDRKLLSGIMATAMTYIVILVQLQISLNSPGHSADSKNSTNTTALQY